VVAVSISWLAPSPSRMTEPTQREPRAAPGAGGNASKGFSHRLAVFRGFGSAVAGRLKGVVPDGVGAISAGVLLLGLAGGILLIVSELLPVWHVDVVTASCEDLADPSLADACVGKGYEQHAFALLVLGVFAILMAWGAGIGQSRPAGLALIVIGAVVLGFALFGDAPDTDKTGSIGLRFDQAKTSAGAGFYLEIVAAALVILAGVLRALVPPPEERPARRAVTSSATGG
jgi:hypothetical protein